MVNEKKMDNTGLKVLSLEDSARDFEIICERLESAGYNPIAKRVEKKDDYEFELRNGAYDIIISDFQLPGYNAFGSLSLRAQICPEIPFICFSGSIGEETAIELLKLGAEDYVLKDRPDRLPFAVKRALDDAKEKAALRESQRSLKESEEKFRNIFNNHSAVKLIISPTDGSIVDANIAAANFYGWSVEELRKMNISQIYLLTQDQLGSAMKKVATKNTNHCEYKHRKADGTIVDVEIFSSLVEFGDKKFLHSIVHDISEKKIAERQVKLLSKAIEQSSVSIVITDYSGKILYVNPFFTDVTGYSSDEVTGENPRVLKSGSQPSEFYEEMWDTILSGKMWQGEFRNKKKNGDFFWESATISPIINEDGDITHFVAIKEDVSEKKKMFEELIEAKEKAEEMNRIKSNFFANMSHELRTPFVGILGYAELMTESLKEGKEKIMAGAILKSATRMQNTLAKILGLAHLESETARAVRKECKALRLITNICETYKGGALRKNLKFKTDLNCGDLLIMSDESLIGDILGNLISNAIIYSDKGTIEITADNTVRNNSDYLTIKVKDEGIGIPAESLMVIWEPFRQASEGFGREFEGTGLGLSIVKKSCELLGGKISVESEKGKGSVFTVELPIEVIKTQE